MKTGAENKGRGAVMADSTRRESLKMAIVGAALALLAFAVVAGAVSAASAFNDALASAEQTRERIASDAALVRAILGADDDVDAEELAARAKAAGQVFSILAAAASTPDGQGLTLSTPDGTKRPMSAIEVVRVLVQERVAQAIAAERAAAGKQ